MKTIKFGFNVNNYKNNENPSCLYETLAKNYEKTKEKSSLSPENRSDIYKDRSQSPTRIRKLFPKFLLRVRTLFRAFEPSEQDFSNFSSYGSNSPVTLIITVRTLRQKFNNFNAEFELLC